MINMSTVVNVKDFGAKGDGITDDTQAIKGAIEHAQTVNGQNSYRRKSIIYFPNGVYLISETIVFHWYMIILGEHEKLAVIKAKNNSNLEYMVDTRGSMNGRIKSILLDGNKENNGAQNGLLLQGTIQYDNLSFSIDSLSVENCMKTGIVMMSPCFGLHAHRITVYNCDEYGIYDASTDNKIYQVDVWKCKKAGVFVAGANNHYIGGKLSYNGTKGDYATANLIITNTRNIFSNLDTQDGDAHGVILRNAFDNILKGVLSDCNGDRALTVSGSCGFILINSKNNIMDIASTNGFYGKYPNCQYYGLKMDINSTDNIINYVHSRQAIPVDIENYHNTINGINLADKIIEKHKYGNKGLLKNMFANSNFKNASRWQGGNRIVSFSNDSALISTQKPHARLSQKFIPVFGKSYFLKATVKTNMPEKVNLGLEHSWDYMTKPTKNNEYEDIFVLVKMTRKVTTPEHVGLYISDEGVICEVKNMICYELTDDLAKLTAIEINDIVTYNNPNAQDNNNVGLGNGYKLSIM